MRPQKSIASSPNRTISSREENMPGPRATGVRRLRTLARRRAVCAGRRCQPTSGLRVDRGLHRDGSVRLEIDLHAAATGGDPSGRATRVSATTLRSREHLGGHRGCTGCTARPPSNAENPSYVKYQTLYVPYPPDFTQNFCATIDHRGRPRSRESPACRSSNRPQPYFHRSSRRAGHWATSRRLRSRSRTQWSRGRHPTSSRRGTETLSVFRDAN